MNDCPRPRKAGFILRTHIYGVYADHFAHLGRVFSATNADLRRRDRTGAEYKHSSYIIRRSGDVDCRWLIARDLCVYAGFYAEYKINPSP